MSGRRRVWLWAAAVWVALVAVAGGLTLWLQDSSEPPGPALWQRSGPQPTLPEGWATACPGPSLDPDTTRVIIVCGVTRG
ncbi:hypothetical protein [Streptomyces sp. SID13726]|uniref:hypothetical protein n=1 Tax=Streptomyces sp. SID13726 TaxID=2706058 RepID=UPI0031BB7516